LGGSGTSVLSAAGTSADNILVGGPKKSVLTAGSGHDILIGGGPATLNAGTGDDILIAGSTIDDANPAALLSLTSAWTGPRLTSSACRPSLPARSPSPTWCLRQASAI
jgi:hypothetical protein